MDENIIKINLVETADKLATLDILDNHGTSDETELMVQAEDDENTLIWKEDVQDEYNELYDFYYNLLTELEVVEV